MRKNFPDLFLYCKSGSYDTSTWGAINHSFPESTMKLSVTGLQKYTAKSRPSGEISPDVAYGMEGDTPSFLMLIQQVLMILIILNEVDGAADMSYTNQMISL